MAKKACFLFSYNEFLLVLNYGYGGFGLAHSVFLLPGNDDLKGSFESYLEKYRPDDVIIMIHATKYRTFAAHSPEFVGLG